MLNQVPFVQLAPQGHALPRPPLAWLACALRISFQSWLFVQCPDRPPAPLCAARATGPGRSGGLEKTTPGPQGARSHPALSAHHRGSPQGAAGPPGKGSSPRSSEAFTCSAGLAPISATRRPSGGHCCFIRRREAFGSCLREAYFDSVWLTGSSN